ncbi:MAG TPA: VOC family protein, partial [Streptosporangiaceae bacterium]|nr:VOC family protein [Streptosporangiaceae bacterium]
MTCQLVALCIDASDPLGLARFWSGVLGWEMADDSRDGVALVPGDDTGFRIRFLAAQEKEPGLSLGHLHLTSTSLEDQQQTVARSLGLGAR